MIHLVWFTVNGKAIRYYYVQTTVEKQNGWSRYMRRALVTGGNSKFGKAFVRELKKSYHVTVIDREDLLSKDLDKYRGVYELVFFNHHYTPEEFEAMGRQAGFNDVDFYCQTSGKHYEVRPGLEGGKFMIAVFSKQGYGYPKNKTKGGVLENQETMMS